MGHGAGMLPGSAGSLPGKPRDLLAWVMRKMRLQGLGRHDPKLSFAQAWARPASATARQIANKPDGGPELLNTGSPCHLGLSQLQGVQHPLTATSLSL